MPLALLLHSAVAGCGIDIQPYPVPTDDPRIHVTVKMRLVETPEMFRAAVVELGAPQDEQHRIPSGWQTVIVQLAWTDSPTDDGWFHLIAFDKRVTPPRPLAGGGSWSADGSKGPFGTSAWDRLAKRYDWLANLGSNQQPDGSWTQPFSTPGVFAPASRTGTMTAWWFNRGPGEIQAPLRLEKAETDVVLALIYEGDHGGLRWVNQING